MAGSMKMETCLFLVMQYLREQGLSDSARSLERESGLFFSMVSFKEMILNGLFDEAEYYLQGFTTIEDNSDSARLIFVLKKLKFFEALDNGNRQSAFEIARTEFPPFRAFNEQLYDEAMKLVTLKNLRSYPTLRNYNKEHIRQFMLEKMMETIKKNEAFEGKLKFPALDTSLQDIFRNWDRGQSSSKRPLSGVVHSRRLNGN